MLELTKKQHAVLHHCFEVWQEQGHLPTVREIGAVFNIAIGAVQRYMDALVKKGYVLRDPKRRQLSLHLENTWDLFGLPVIGRVSAGLPNLADAEVIERLKPTDLYPMEAHYALLVRGESMIGAGIMPGDRVFVRETTDAVHGDIVIATIGNEDGVIKRYINEHGSKVLRSENPLFEDISFDDPTHEITIHGKVVGRWGRL